MLSLDLVRRELKTLQGFDIIFWAAEQHPREDCLGYLRSQYRKNELIDLAAALASTN